MLRSHHVMKRSGRLAILALVPLGLGFAAFACDTFSGGGGPQADASLEATDETTPPSDDGGDSPDASGGACTSFDAAAYAIPDGDLTNQVCGQSAGKNLTNDARNCGWCGHDCLESSCDGAGHCAFTTVVSGPPTSGYGIALVTLDDAGAYWLSTSPGTIFRSNVDQPGNADAATLLTQVDASEPVTSNVYALAVDDRLYVRTFFNLYAAPLSGGPLATFYGGPAESTGRIAAGAGHVVETLDNGKFRAFSEADGGLLLDAPNNPGANDLAVTPDGRYAFFLARTAEDAGIPADATVPESRAVLYRFAFATRDSQRITDLAFETALSQPLMAADNDFVYFPERGSGAILRLPVDASPGATPTVVAPGDGGRVGRLALDADRVYWFSSTDGGNAYYTLYGAPKCGGDTRTYLAPTGDTFIPSGLAAYG
jgi:hypothetical protein